MSNVHDIRDCTEWLRDFFIKRDGEQRSIFHVASILQFRLSEKKRKKFVDILIKERIREERKKHRSS